MLYLAMTEAEISKISAVPDPLAYMACHFSPYGTGLSNLPEQLPAGSMLILNDLTPPMGHDPQRIAQDLQQAALAFSCSRILLDFQRAGDPATKAIAKAVIEQAPCPVGVSDIYAKNEACAVFLPPLPLHETAEAYLAPWQEREIWMEAALDAMTITVTATGSRYAACMPPLTALPHFDGELLCHYSTALTDDAAVFTLHRTYEDLQRLMEDERISCFVGLYQELKGVP